MPIADRRSVALHRGRHETIRGRMVARRETPARFETTRAARVHHGVTRSSQADRTARAARRVGTGEGHPVTVFSPRSVDDPRGGGGNAAWRLLTVHMFGGRQAVGSIGIDVGQVREGHAG